MRTITKRNRTLSLTHPNILILATLIGTSMTAGITGLQADDIMEDFSSPLSSDWLTHAPLAAALGFPVTVSVGDGVLTLSHPPSPIPDIAPASLGVKRMDVNWSEFEVSVEFSGWTVGDKVDSDIFLTARLQTGEDGLGNDYLLVIGPSGLPEAVAPSVPFPFMSLERIVSEAAAPGGSLAVGRIPKLDPAKWYRAVFKGLKDSPTGNLRLMGSLFEVGNAEPIANLFASIRRQVYFSGGVGFGIFDRAALNGVANNGVAAKFDNFKASGTPVVPVSDPPLTIDRSLVLTWPVATAPGTLLETAASLDGPFETAPYTPLIAGDQFQVTVPAANDSQFFRLRTP